MTEIEFIKKMKSDEAFRSKLQEAEKAGKLDEFTEENGCSFTLDQLKRANEELSDDELEAVSGGFKIEWNPLCQNDGHCGLTCESDLADRLSTK